MKGSGMKITIKPRRGRGRGGASAAASSSRRALGDEAEPMDVDVEEASQPGSGSGTPRDGDGEVKEESGSEQQSVENENEVERDDGHDIEEDEEGNEGADELEGERDLAMSKPRGRGRGRGRGTGTPRARGPGRPRGSRGGRGRGRGSRGGLTIKLPRREDGTVEGDGEEGGEEGLATPVMEGTAEEAVAERPVPLGGGKPFRRINGRIYVIDGDEYAMDDDPKGDSKIDGNGNLLEGRRFKAQTFTLPNRHPERLYMLAIEAARTSGFRDSLYYFRRNPLAFKLNATQPEKDYLIDQGKLGSHLRTRSVTLITARSAYKLHGAKMIADGRWVIDDYYEDKVLEEITAKGLKPGDPVGELQEPQAAESKDIVAVADRAVKADRGGAGPSMYRPGGPTTIFGGSGWGPYSEGPLNAVKKSMLSRDGVNEENFMFVAAQRAMEASRDWAKLRRDVLTPCGGILGDVSRGKEREGFVDEGEERNQGRRRKRRRDSEDDLPQGVYEPHTAIVLYRGDTQPTRSRWEALPDSDERRAVLGGTKTGNGAWALAWVDTLMELPPDTEAQPPPVDSTVFL